MILVVILLWGNELNKLYELNELNELNEPYEPLLLFNCLIVLSDLS